MLDTVSVSAQPVVIFLHSRLKLSPIVDPASAVASLGAVYEPICSHIFSVIRTSHIPVGAAGAFHIMS